MRRPACRVVLASRSEAILNAPILRSICDFEDAFRSLYRNSHWPMCRLTRLPLNRLLGSDECLTGKVAACSQSKVFNVFFEISKMIAPFVSKASHRFQYLSMSFVSRSPCHGPAKSQPNSPTQQQTLLVGHRLASLKFICRHRSNACELLAGALGWLNFRRPPLKRHTLAWPIST